MLLQDNTKPTMGHGNQETSKFSGFLRLYFTWPLPGSSSEYRMFVKMRKEKGERNRGAAPRDYDVSIPRERSASSSAPAPSAVSSKISPSSSPYERSGSSSTGADKGG